MSCRPSCIEQADRLFRGEVTQERMAEADRGEWPSAISEAIERAGLALALVPEGAGRRRPAAGRCAATDPPLRLPHATGAAGGDHDRSSALVRRFRVRPLQAQCPWPRPAWPMPSASSAAQAVMCCKGGHSASLGARKWTMFWSMRVTQPGAGYLALLPRGAAPAQPHRNLANEPRDTLLLDGITVPTTAVRPAPPACAEGLMPSAR